MPPITESGSPEASAMHGLPGAVTELSWADELPGAVVPGWKGGVECKGNVSENAACGPESASAGEGWLLTQQFC